MKDLVIVIKTWAKRRGYVFVCVYDVCVFMCMYVCVCIYLAVYGFLKDLTKSSLLP